MNNDTVRRIVNYCSEEVRRQGETDPVRVAQMVDAWLFAIENSDDGAELDIPLIEHLGRKIKPDLNKNGFRTIPIYVGSFDQMYEKAKPLTIIPRLERLIEGLPRMTPLDAYVEFEEIHPFRDGNGRTGKIILNWLMNTLRDPVFPPADLWGEPISNP